MARGNWAVPSSLLPQHCITVFLSLSLSYRATLMSSSLLAPSCTWISLSHTHTHTQNHTHTHTYTNFISLSISIIIALSKLHFKCFALSNSLISSKKVKRMQPPLSFLSQRCHAHFFFSCHAHRQTQVASSHVCQTFSHSSLAQTSWKDILGRRPLQKA